MAASAAVLRDRIREATREMSASAAEGDWQRARDQGELRANLLEALFAVVSEPHQEVSLIEQILDADRALRHLALEDRERLSEELWAHQQRGQAARRYLDAASLDS
ncbi:MAG: flagellar protein FliT [Pseudomonadales bacterium]